MARKPAGRSAQRQRNARPAFDEPQVYGARFPTADEIADAVYARIVAAFPELVSGARPSRSVRAPTFHGRQLLTAAEAAVRYGHRSTRGFYQWLKARRGTLKGVHRRGRTILIDSATFERHHVQESI